MPQKCTALYYANVILMLQWYNHSIDSTTLSSYTSVLASVLTYLLPQKIYCNILQTVISSCA